MVAGTSRETRVSPPPPPPPLSSSPPDVLESLASSAASMRLSDWRRRSHRNRIATIVPVVIFCCLLIVAGIYYMAVREPSGLIGIVGGEKPVADEAGPAGLVNDWAIRRDLRNLLADCVADPNFDLVKYKGYKDVIYIKIRQRSLGGWVFGNFQVRPNGDGTADINVWPYYPPDFE